MVITHQTMGEMENMLPAGKFIRIHKSYIVAAPRIRSVFGNSVEMDKVNLPIGLSYKERIMAYVEGKRS